MKNAGFSLVSRASVLALGIFSATAASSLSLGQEMPESTAIPVIFSHSIEAGRAKPGDAVVAKTIQMVVLPGGKTLPKGANLIRIQKRDDLVMEIIVARVDILIPMNKDFDCRAYSKHRGRCPENGVSD